jgi:hypothetical protein
MRRVGAAVIVVMSVASGMAQQPPPVKGPAPAIISGALADAASGQPVRKAQVRLMTLSPSGPVMVTASDDQGRFVFTGVRAGEYTVAASKPGYLEMVFGARRAGPAMAGTPVRVVAGQKLDGINVRLPRGSVITGTITDEFGEAAFQIPVRAMRYVFSNGARYATAAGHSAVTDDRGDYRIAGLPPGEYIVSAVPRDVVSVTAGMNDELRGRIAAAFAQARAAGNEVPTGMRPDALERVNAEVDPRGYVPVHYPGSVLPSGAATVRVGERDEVAGIDIRLQIVHTARVTGTVTWAEGAVPAGARIQLLDPSMPMPTVGAWWTNQRPGGRFVFYGVVPGSYVVRLHTSSGGADLIGAVDVQVAASQANEVDLAIVRGPTVSGTVALDGAPVPLSRIRVVLRPVSLPADPEMAMERVPVDAAGRFTLRGLVPARYRVQLEGLPAGWSIESAIFGDRDAADYLLEVESGRNLPGGVIKLTSKVAELSGAVTTAAGQPVLNATVLVFPQDRRLWVPQSRRILAVSPGADGRYVLRDLPPGDYRVAVGDPEPGQIFDVEYLSQLVTIATPVTIAAGEKKTHDIRVN